MKFKKKKKKTINRFLNPKTLYILLLWGILTETFLYKMTKSLNITFVVVVYLFVWKLCVSLCVAQQHSFYKKKKIGWFVSSLWMLQKCVFIGFKLCLSTSQKNYHTCIHTNSYRHLYENKYTYYTNKQTQW